MVSLRRLLFLLGATALTTAVIHRLRRGPTGVETEGGILIGDASAYDKWSRRLFGSFFEPIAEDVAGLAPPDGQVLDVGCGPGLLSIKLAQRGLRVTGLDLDPAMIERAKANADRAADDASRPDFVLGSVSALPFADATFDIVVSTLSMHHWSDPVAGLIEIARVLRPTGRALIWDLRPGLVPFHRHAPDPLERIHGAPLRLVAATPWRWPWRLALSERIELVAVPSGVERGTVKARKPRRAARATSRRPREANQTVD